MGREERKGKAMKKLMLLAALAAASAAWAQAPADKKEPAKPEAASAAPSSPTAGSQEATTPQGAKPAPLAKKSRRFQDARHCLERPTNTEVIKCAEEYL